MTFWDAKDWHHDHLVLVSLERLNYLGGHDSLVLSISGLLQLALLSSLMFTSCLTSTGWTIFIAWGDQSHHNDWCPHSRNGHLCWCPLTHVPAACSHAHIVVL